LCADSAKVKEYRESYQGEAVMDPPQESPGVGINSATDWAALVERIRSGNSIGMEELYGIFSRGVRYYLCRQLGLQELDDKVHDTFLIVVQAIQKGELRDANRLMGFVRTVVRRQVAAHIDDAVHSRRERVEIEPGAILTDHRENPEQIAMGGERLDIMEQALREISRRDCEILTRFYLDGQPQEQVCREMGLSETQFRLLKSRAKARFGALGRRHLEAKDPPPKKSMRKSAGV